MIETGREPDQLGLGSAERGTGGPADAGVDVGLGSTPTNRGTREEHESVDLDGGVDIDIGEFDDADEDDESGE